jgi:hypothetical protein
MRLFHLSVHPAIIVVAGIASGALALGASALGTSSSPSTAPSKSSRASAAASPRAATKAFAAVGAASAGAPKRFPALYAPQKAAEAPRITEVLLSPPIDQAEADPSALIPAIANNQILAFYGKPDSKCMGILGEYSKEELAAMLDGYAKLYDEKNGPDGVVGAFYLIYGTCWPGGEIGYLRESMVKEYIDYAAQKGMLVFLDHQIGKYPVADAVQRLLPWLKYPNVHLALDPEWRTESPMEEIGSVSAEEINAAEAAMSAYMNAEGIGGDRMLVLHQFKAKMISGRERVKADYDGVVLVHTADGFGSPALKRMTYSYNAKALNLPIKGFKLFFKTTVQGAGYDEPLLLPDEVLSLEPSPRLVIYQ